MNGLASQTLQRKLTPYRAALRTSRSRSDRLAIEVVDRKREVEQRPLVGEFLPLLLSEMAGVSRRDQRRLMRAWYALYGATLFLDEAADSGKVISPAKLLNAALLVNNANNHLVAIGLQKEVLAQVLGDLSIALEGEKADVSLRGQLNASREASDIQKNQVFIAIARVVGSLARKQVDVNSLASQLIPIIQALDDYGDIDQDISENNYTTLISNIYAAANLETVTYETIVASGLEQGHFTLYIKGISEAVSDVLAQFSDHKLTAPHIYLEDILSSLRRAEDLLAVTESDFVRGVITKRQAISQFEKTLPLVAQSS